MEAKTPKHTTQGRGRKQFTHPKTLIAAQLIALVETNGAARRQWCQNETAGGQQSSGPDGWWAPMVRSRQDWSGCRLTVQNRLQGRDDFLAKPELPLVLEAHDVRKRRVGLGPRGPAQVQGELALHVGGGAHHEVLDKLFILHLAGLRSDRDMLSGDDHLRKNGARAKVVEAARNRRVQGGQTGGKQGNAESIARETWQGRGRRASRCRLLTLRAANLPCRSRFCTSNSRGWRVPSMSSVQSTLRTVSRVRAGLDTWGMQRTRLFGRALQE